MPFPDSPRVVYKNNPLVEVICQLRFPTILRIGSDQPADFQERIRAEYPLYGSQEAPIDLPQLPKGLAPILEQINLPRPSRLATHRFITRDSRRFISLAQDFMALIELDYTRWEPFRQELERAEAALRETYAPAFFTRLGLRYRNVISRDRLGLAGAEWSDLLQPHIVAELGDVAVSSQIAVTETASILRTLDVLGGQVRLLHGLVKDEETGEQCYAIDCDFSITEGKGINEPFETLDKFHRLAGRLFRWAITDVLHTAMEPEAI